MRLVALDWVNFLLADVRGGLGAYVNVYLLTDAHWSQATIGAVLTVSGLTGIMLHPSVGAWIDKTRGKRGLLIASTVVLSVCGLAVVWAPTILVVLAADVTMAVLGGVFAPVVAAITVGLVYRDALPARLGRNAIFDRVGNVFMAVVMGIFGTIFSQGTPSHGVFPVKLIHFGIVRAPGVWIRSVSPSLPCSPDDRITSHPVELVGSDHNPSCSRVSGSGWRDHPF
jgi:MFS family permease